MKLIKNDMYLLLIDEEAEISKTGTLIYENDTNLLNITSVDYEPQGLDSKIIAYYPLTKEAKELDLSLLPNPFEEINIEDLSEKANGYAYYGKPLGEKYLAFKEGFIEGYKAAQSKQLELLKRAIQLASDAENIEEVEEEIIQSLSTQQLPKELDLPLLPPFEKDVEKKMFEAIQKARGSDFKTFYRLAAKNCAEVAAQSKQFSLEDLKKTIDLTQQICDRNAHYVQRDRKVHVPMITIDEEEEIIQALSTQQLPKEFVPEYRYYYHSSKEFYSDAGFIECSKEQYESIKAEIPTCPLKTELKTITNSEGKQELVGEYQY